MIRLSRFLILSIGLITFSVLTTACQGGTKLAETTATSRPTFTPQPSRTPRPSQTPSSTATPPPTTKPTHTPKPTIQLPKLALTPLPFTPEPILPLIAGRITELTRWEVDNPLFWQNTDGSSMNADNDFSEKWAFQLAFFSNGSTTLALLPVNMTSERLVFSHSLDNARCILGEKDRVKGNFFTKDNFPGIPYLSILDGKQIDFNPTKILMSLNIENGEYLFSPNGETLVIQYGRCQIQFINLESGSSSKVIGQYGDDQFGYSQNGKVLWLGPKTGNNIAFYNPENANLLQKTKVEWKHLTEISQAESQKISGLNAEKIKKPIPDDYKRFQIIALAPDKNNFISSIHLKQTLDVALGDGRYGQIILKGKLNIALWRMSDGTMLHVLLEKDEWEGEPIAVFSPDGMQVAIYSGSDPGIQFFDVVTGKRIRQLGKSGYLKLEYSPDGQILIAGTDESLELWDVSTGNLLIEIPIPAKLDDWAISPDGRYIGTVSEDGIINLWGVVP